MFSRLPKKVLTTYDLDEVKVYLNYQIEPRILPVLLTILIMNIDHLISKLAVIQSFNLSAVFEMILILFMYQDH